MLSNKLESLAELCRACVLQGSGLPLTLTARIEELLRQHAKDARIMEETGIIDLGAMNHVMIGYDLSDTTATVVMLDAFRRKVDLPEVTPGGAA